MMKVIIVLLVVLIVSANGKTCNDPLQDDCCGPHRDCLHNESCEVCEACSLGDKKCIYPCATRNPCGTNAICEVSTHHTNMASPLPLPIKCRCPKSYIGNPMTNCELRSPIFVIPGNNQKTVQVVDVDGSATCSDLALYPVDPTWGGGGLLENTPVLCGGYPITTECYSYDKDSTTWNLVANLVTGRRHFGAAIFKGALWLTGGVSSSSPFYLDSTEIIALDGTVTSGTNLPNGIYGHSMVVINDDEFMILGSRIPEDQHRNTMTYNANSETFSSGPDLIYDRQAATCSMFQSKLHNDRQVVLCAGGVSDQGTAELLDFSQENAMWTEVDDLPIKRNQWGFHYGGARSMPSLTGDGVYLRAGKYLFLFTCDESSCQWTTLKVGLQTAAYGVMMPLPSGYSCE